MHRLSPPASRTPLLRRRGPGVLDSPPPDRQAPLTTAPTGRIRRVVLVIRVETARRERQGQAPRPAERQAPRITVEKVAVEAVEARSSAPNSSAVAGSLPRSEKPTKPTGGS